MSIIKEVLKSGGSYRVILITFDIWRLMFNLQCKLTGKQ
ncbi:hypothetical protein VPH5P1C_0153 [Vibrio phage 5P1c]